ncbi:MAG: LysR family transcriptional regulator, partial [Clostridia bacterium]
LSKAIRELEDSFGISIFNRTSKGVVPTARGKEFLSYAKNILAQVDEMETMYKPSLNGKQKFDISVPRASYISHAFTEFVKSLDLTAELSLNYRETNSVRAMKNVFDNTNNLAIVRYQTIYEKYFLRSLEERDLNYKDIWEFENSVIMSKNHPLANAEIVDFESLEPYIEIVHGDLTVPTLPITEARRIAMNNETKKNIAIYERASQFELLARIPTTYMWVSPMPQDILNCFSLVQTHCPAAKNRYKDILIFRKNYKLDEAVSFVSK